MFSFLLDLVSDDGNPDFVVNSYSFDIDSFVVGIIAGVAISLVIWGISYIIKMYIDDDEKNSKEDNSKKNDE